jgi:hypothetical protein
VAWPSKKFLGVGDYILEVAAIDFIYPSYAAFFLANTSLPSYTEMSVLDGGISTRPIIISLGPSRVRIINL